MRTRWCHLSTIPGTTQHCLVNTEGNVNLLGLGALSSEKVASEAGLVDGFQRVLTFLPHIVQVPIPSPGCKLD